MQKAPRVILGIDPGTQVLGYGILRYEGKKSEVITAGVVKLEKFSDHSVRLKRIFERITSLIEMYEPTEMALEAPFFGKNVQSMLKLGRAQGVSMAAGLMKGMSISEYAPRKVKQSITGKGNATKEQVAEMLQRLLKFEEMPKYLDATDALGVAYCHFIATTNVIDQQAKATKKNAVTASKSKKTSWSEFVTKNEKRIIK